MLTMKQIIRTERFKHAISPERQYDTLRFKRHDGDTLITQTLPAIAQNLLMHEAAVRAALESPTDAFAKIAELDGKERLTTLKFARDNETGEVLSGGSGAKWRDTPLTATVVLQKTCEMIGKLGEGQLVWVRTESQPLSSRSHTLLQNAQDLMADKNSIPAPAQIYIEAMAYAHQVHQSLHGLFQQDEFEPRRRYLVPEGEGKMRPTTAKIWASRIANPRFSA